MVTKEVLSQYIDLQEEKLNQMGMLLTVYQVGVVVLNISVLKDSLTRSTAEREHCFIPERLPYSY